MKLHLPKGLLVAVMATFAILGATVQAVGTGWAGPGQSYGEIPSGTKVLYVGPKDNDASGGFSRNGMGTVSTDANGNTVIDSVDVDAYEDGLTSFRISSDVDGNTATIKSLSVLESSNITVGISGWNQNAFADLIIEQLTVENLGSAVINVETGQTTTLGQVNGSYTAEVAGTLKLTGTHTYSAANIVRGNGWLVVTDGAVLTLDYGSSHGAVKTNLKVEGGGTLECLKGDSAAGWGATDQGPNLLTLAGTSATDSTSAKLATMSVSEKQTIGQGISMQGNAQITNVANSTGAIELYKQGEVLTVSGENNFIYTDVQIGTYANIINVEENGELTISGDFYTQSNHSGASLTKAGDGVLVFSGTSTFDKVYTHGAGTTTFGGMTTFNKGMEVTSGGVEFKSTSEITLQGAINVGDNGSVTFNGNKLTLAGQDLKKNPYLAGQTFTENGVNGISSEYTIVTGNQTGVTGTVKVEGVDQVQEINQGKVLGAPNYYVIAVDNTQYDKTAHSGIENFGGYLVTNKATFDLNLQDDGAGFQPHLYLDEGSIITNNNANLGTGKIAILNATLVGDATVHAEDGHQFGMLRNSWNESKLMLGGHTLTKTGEGIFHLVNTTVSNGTIDVTAGKLLIESQTGYYANGTSFDNATINLGAKGTLQINSMKNSAAVGELVSATTGSGQIELNTTAELTNTQSTQATGKLTINSGATLEIGSSEAQTVDISSLSSVVLNGGSLRYENKGGTIQGLSTTSAGGTFYMNDMGQVVDAAKLVFSNTTKLDGQLTFKNTWNCQIEIKTLGGSGNFVIDGAERKSTNDSTIYISGVDAYTGEVQMINGASNMTLNVADDLGLNVKYRTRSGQADLSQIGSGNTIHLAAFAGSIKSGTVQADVAINNAYGTDGAYYAGVELLSATEGDKITYAGTVKGTGNYIISTGDVSSTTEFTGDVSGWTAGHLRVASGSQNVTYTGDATNICHQHVVDENAELNLSMDHKKAVTVSGKITQDEGTINLSVANSHADGTTFTNETNIAKATIEAGTKVTFTNAAVTVDDILVKAAAQLSFSGVESLSVAKLETNTDASVTVGTIENHDGKVLTVTDLATFNGGTINADLKLADGAKVAFNDTVAMGSTLTLGTNLTLSGTKLNEIKSLTSASQTVVLFTGVDTLTLGEQSFSMAENQELTASNGVKLSNYFTTEDDTDLGNYYLGFNADGNLYAGLMVVPEPATATLSLLALAGLCARRRRKS